MISIQNTSAEHSAVSVGSMIHRQSVCQVIDEGELWAVGFIVASDEHVDMISVASSQVVSQVLACEVSGSFRSQLVAVAHFVQQNVLGNVLDELNCVAGVTDSSNQQRVREFVDLVGI